MTGRDLIMYILENGLENEQVFSNGKFLGFLTLEETAIKFDVGVETVIAWHRLNMIPGILIGGTLYIPGNTEDPRNKKLEKGV